MRATQFSHNGTVLPVSNAHVPLDDIAYSYGFGVYETIRVSDGIAYFTNQHLERLLQSAQIIGLQHQFTKEFISESLHKLIDADTIVTANAKILLIGGRTEMTANLYIQMLQPFFPDRNLYRDGAHANTFANERLYPHAKTLNMLPSYIAYTQAKKSGAYDALLVNRNGEITEGTRTNVFAVKGRTLISPPEDQILLGVMRAVVLRVAADQGIELKTERILRDQFDTFDGLFLTSTSSKVMPIKSVDDYSFDQIPVVVTELIGHVKTFLETSNGVMKELGD